MAIEIEKNVIELATLKYLQVAGLPLYDVNADADKYSRAVPIAMRYNLESLEHITIEKYQRNIRRDLSN